MHEEIRHPCVQHKLSLIRNVETGHKRFRELATEITMFVCYEALKNVRVRAVDVRTPLATAKCHVIDEDVVVIPILRAGVGMLEGILSLLPSARVGFIGLERDEATAEASAYYQKMPYQIRGGISIIVDPMLATGGTLVATIDLLKSAGCRSVRGIFLVAAPEGLQRLQASHADVEVFVAAVDERLNEAGYILPGLGDAGDRIFGTR